MTGYLPSNMTATPGIYYLLAYLLSSCLYIHLNKKRFEGFKRIGIQLLLFGCLSVFMLVTDGIAIQWFVPCALFEIFLIWLTIYSCCDITWEKATYFCIRTFILGEFAASLEWQILYYGWGNWNIDHFWLWNVLCFVVIHGWVFGVKSIQRIAEKYDGSVTFTAKDDWFELRILLPMKAI